MFTTGPTLTLVTHKSKAVAVGAVSYHFVAGKTSRLTYSPPNPYHPFNP